MRERFRNRIAAVAGEVEESEQRHISDASIEVESDEASGIVRISVTWAELAEHEGDTLVLSEPFASGFESPQRLVVSIPDGWTVDETSPSPETMEEGYAEWSADTTLDDFALETSPVAADNDSDSSLPGFTLITTIIGVITGARIARHQ